MRTSACVTLATIAVLSIAIVCNAIPMHKGQCGKGQNVAYGQDLIASPNGRTSGSCNNHGDNTGMINVDNILEPIMLLTKSILLFQATKSSWPELLGESKRFDV